MGVHKTNRVTVATVVLALGTLPLRTALCADPKTSLSVNIAPQPLDAALVELSKQGHLQLVIATGSLPDRMCVPLHGSMTFAAALERLLKDTGLTYKFVGDHTIAIVKPIGPVSQLSAPPATPGASGATGLGTQPDDNVVAGNENTNKGEQTVNHRGILLRIATFLGICVSASMSSTACAQQASEPEAQGLDEIVVTAQRREERLQDVPFTVTALSAESLAVSGVVAVPDLPEIVPGLTWSGQGAWAQPSLRGVSTTVASPGSGSPIAIYLDGVYQPQQLSTIVDLPDVTSIEVLKGPQGTLFGRNATGGAILINTVEPSFRPEGQFEAQTGFYSGGQSDTAVHVLAKGSLSGPIISDLLAGSISAYANYTPGYIRDIQDGDRLGSINSDVVRGKLLLTPDDHTSILATAYYGRREDHTAEAAEPVNGVTVAAKYPGAIVPTAPWTGAYYSPAEPDFQLGNFGSSLRVSERFDGAGTLTSTTGYNRYTPEVHTPGEMAYSPACYAAFACYDYDTRVPEVALSEELLFTSEQLGRLHFVSGVYGFYDKGQEGDRVDEGVLFSADSRIYTRSIAVFAEGNYNLTDALTGVVGLRFNHETKVAESRFGAGAFENFANASWNGTTPRVSLQYKLTNTINTYATFSEGFKGGVVATQFTTAPPANPEKLYSYEMGAKYAEHDRSLNAAIFYYKYKDMQQEYDYGLVSAPANAASATIYGLDLDGAAKLTDDFQLRSSIEWLPTARFDSYPAAIAFTFPLGPFGLTTVSPYNANGSRLFIAPVFVANLTPEFTKSLTAGVVDASANLYFSSAYRFEVTGRVQQGSYATLNLRAGLSPASLPKVRFGIYARNLTNRAYYSGALLSAEADSTFYAPPREIGLSFNASMN
jgi:iron complex outermembrane receptor protein